MHSIKEKGRAPGLPLKNPFYNYLYFPAYKALKFMGFSVTAGPFLYHIFIGIYGIFSLILVFLLFLRKVSLGIKIKTLILWSLPALLFASIFVFVLKPKGRILQTFELKNAPLADAFSVGLQEKGKFFQILKSKGKWVKIKTSQNQKGWALKENLYFTRD